MSRPRKLDLAALAKIAQIAAVVIAAAIGYGKLAGGFEALQKEVSALRTDVRDISNRLAQTERERPERVRVAAGR